MRAPLFICPTGQTNKQTDHTVCQLLGLNSTNTLPRLFILCVNCSTELILGNNITLVFYPRNNFRVSSCLCFTTFLLCRFFLYIYFALISIYPQHSSLSQDMLERIGAVTIDAVANISCVDVFIFVFLVFLLFVFPFFLWLTFQATYFAWHLFLKFESAFSFITFLFSPVKRKCLPFVGRSKPSDYGFYFHDLSERESGLTFGLDNH